MTILNADYIVTMPDQSKWKVPVRVIAEDRAQHYFQNSGGEFASLTLAMKDTEELFSEDDYEIEDWAKNNMNWVDVQDQAVRVADGEIDYQEGWCNGDCEIEAEDRDGV